MAQSQVLELEGGARANHGRQSGEEGSEKISLEERIREEV
jgi:hypothetical protein